MTGSIEAAVAALRGGRLVRIDPGPTILSVETGTEAMLALVDPYREARLLISGERAAALGLGNLRDSADGSTPVMLACPPWLDRAAALALIDPAQDLVRGPIGPLTPLPFDDPQGALAAVVAIWEAGLLPAVWLVGGESPLVVALGDLLHRRKSATIVARARLPVAAIGDSQIVAFRDDSTGDEHVALIVGAFAGRPPLVRLHSECLTGDVFGSLKCDCGPQLHEALRLIKADGGGVLLYLRQEGRGIGLANKIRAYQLQDRGLDTVDANRRLGFPDDLRDYGLASAILRALGIESVRLLTNNPSKLRGLEEEGITVVERVSHHMPANPHNADYIATKRHRSGHLD